jgi:hypothetical protein
MAGGDVNYYIRLVDYFSPVVEKVMKASAQATKSLDAMAKQSEAVDKAMATAGTAANTMARGIEGIGKAAQSSVSSLRSFVSEVRTVQSNLEKGIFNKLNAAPSGGKGPGPMFSGSHNALGYALNAYLGYSIGQSMAHTAGHVLQKANEQIMAKYKMGQVGFDDNLMRGADSAVGRLTNKYTNVSKGELYEQLYEGVSIYGNAEESLHNVEQQARLMSFLKVWEGGAHSGNSKKYMQETYAAIKSMEMRGVLNEEDPTRRQAGIDNYMNSMIAMKVLYGDQANLNSYLAAQRKAGSSFYKLSDDFRFNYMPAMIQERGGATVGQMLMTAYNTMQGGVKLSKNQLATMSQYDLLDPKTGRYRKDIIQAFTDNPMKAMGMIAKSVAGKDGIDLSTNEGIEKLKNRLPEVMPWMFPNRNASALFMDMFMNEKNLEKHANAMRKVREEMDKIAKGDFFRATTYGGALGSVAKQWDNFLGALGKPLMPGAIDQLNNVAWAMNQMMQMAERHPRMVQWAAVGAEMAVAAVGIGAFARAIGMLMRFSGMSGALRLLGMGLLGLARLSGLTTATAGLLVLGARLGRVLWAARGIMAIGTGIGAAFFIGSAVIENWKTLVGLLERISGLNLGWLKNLGDAASWAKWQSDEKAKEGGGPHSLGGASGMGGAGGTMPTMRQAVDFAFQQPPPLQVHFTGTLDARGMVAVHGAAAVPLGLSASTGQATPTEPH